MQSRKPDGVPLDATKPGGAPLSHISVPGKSGGEVESSDRARLWSPPATAAACAGPVIKARSIGKNCGGTALKQTRW